MTGRVKLSGDPAYTYAVGRVRVRERRLLTKRALVEAAEARSFEGAVDALREAGYEPVSRGGAGLEELLAKQSAELTRFIRESVPDPRLLEYLRLRLDYANLKAALVGRLTERKPPLTEGGAVPPEKLTAFADGGEPDVLPTPFAELARGLLEEWEKARDPFLLQQGVDRALFARLTGLVGEIGLPFLTAYQKLETDLVNLTALVRCLAAPNPEELSAAAFIPGGGLDLVRLEGYARTGDRSGAAEYVGRTPYAELTRGAVEGAPDGIANLAARGADRKLEFLRQARHAPFGAEPLISYYLAKRNEFEMVRFVLTCKLNGVPPETITARLWGVS
ncbi:MAG TPA: V-type ATPase subunit [bacterium]|nr:V-type ATPase subunit [bacterium]